LAKGAVSVELVADPLFFLGQRGGLAIKLGTDANNSVKIDCSSCLLLYIEHFETQHEGAEVVDESSNKSLRPNCLLLPPPRAELLLPSAIDRFRRRLRAARSCTFSVPPPLPANAAADSG
jgi:hypothetical protein